MHIKETQTPSQYIKKNTKKKQLKHDKNNRYKHCLKTCFTSRSSIFNQCLKNWHKQMIDKCLLFYQHILSFKYQAKML